MKKYEKPVVLANNELAEGVFAGSGNCYTFNARVVQTPQLGHEVYTIQMDGSHHASDGHHSATRNVVVSFNMPVSYVSSNAISVAGDGTSQLTLTFRDGFIGSYHNNGNDYIGLGQLVVSAGDGLAVTGCYCNYCDEDCGQGHTW